MALLIGLGRVAQQRSEAGEVLQGAAVRADRLHAAGQLIGAADADAASIAVGRLDGVGKHQLIRVAAADVRGLPPHAADVELDRGRAAGGIDQHRPIEGQHQLDHLAEQISVANNRIRDHRHARGRDSGDDDGVRAHVLPAAATGDPELEFKFGRTGGHG